MNKKYWLKYLDHAADKGIVVQGDTKGDLFPRAAWGMFSLLTDMTTVNPEHKTVLAVQAPDLQGLMVKWLSELNSLHATGHRLFSKFKIQEMSQIYLKAEVYSEEIDPTRHTIDAKIKAVSLNQLKVEYVDGGWQAQVLFDM